MASYFERSIGITSDPRQDPVQWNWQWERLLRIIIRAGHYHRIWQKSSVQEDEMLSAHRKRLQDLCVQQRHLTTYAASFFALRDFESKWLESDESVRQKHLLEGLVRTCTMTSGMENSRLYCEEMTLSHLQKGNGQAFLDLLKFFMIEDTSSVPTYAILLPNPRLEQKTGKRRKDWSEQDKIFHAYYDGIRNVFICFCLENTVASFHGEGPTTVVICKPPARDRLSPALIQEGTRRVGRSALKAMRRELVAGREGTVISCENCHKNQNNVGEDFRFLMCSPCKNNVDRRIFYCSKKCQIEDWRPRHKAICGKKMTLEDAEMTAVGTSPVPTCNRTGTADHAQCTHAIGPPSGGYKRSPALLHQISLLNSDTCPGAAYFLITSSGESSAMILENEEAMVNFREIRTEAMGSGDRGAIAALGQCLLWGHVNSRVSRGELFRQLKKEYGFDVETAVAEYGRRRAREKIRLCGMEDPVEEFTRIMNELQRPELKEEREEVYKLVAKVLTGEIPT